MVILYMYDALNGYRYRRVGYTYYKRIAHSPLIISSFIVYADE